MTSEELQCQNDLADQLLGKLEQIKQIRVSQGFPGQDDLNEIADAADRIAASLTEVKQIQRQGFLNQDDLNEAADDAERLANNLAEGKEQAENYRRFFENRQVPSQR